MSLEGGGGGGGGEIRGLGGEIPGLSPPPCMKHWLLWPTAPGYSYTYVCFKILITTCAPVNTLCEFNNNQQSNS